MKRREFISLLGGAALWPLPLQAQQPAMPVIGYLSGGSPESDAIRLSGFRQGLNETSYVEGRNVAIEFRWAQGQYDRLPALAADLVRRQVTMIAAIGGTPAALAAKAATSTIPIVFHVGIDPVQFGLVASLNRPAGNMTGVAVLLAELEAKRLDFLHELLPTATVVALLVNPSNPFSEPETRNVRDVARSLGLQLHVLQASTANDIDAAFATVVELRAGALVVGADPLFTSRTEQIIALAARHAMPAIYAWSEFTAAGGLISYAPSLKDGHRLAGVYAGRILKGAKPADLPVQQAVKIELVINLKTAMTLGLSFPITLLGRADEVIE
jgi:putative tryptophan/tyrosine transport system substrate-binding protein